MNRDEVIKAAKRLCPGFVPPSMAVEKAPSDHEWRRTGTTNRIKTMLAQKAPLACSEIAAILGLPTESVSPLISKMLRCGVVRRGEMRRTPCGRLRAGYELAEQTSPGQCESTKADGIGALGSKRIRRREHWQPRG